MLRKRSGLLLLCALCIALAHVLANGNALLQGASRTGQSRYTALPPNTVEGDALAGLNDDFTANDSFVTNLPIVIVQADEDIPVYKEYVYSDTPAREEKELVLLDDPWVEGRLRIIDSGTGANRLQDAAAEIGAIRIKRRGHSSILYDKPQYLINLVAEDGSDREADLLDMGVGEGWVLNGSMADKSMMRNYLAYRLAAELAPETPDCRYCELFLERDGVRSYEGVYLLTESIARGETRINIDEARKKNIYTSYILRRDRYSSYDTMLDTYGRLSGISPEWIGVKYPPVRKQTPESVAYMEQDFSHIESVLYSDDPAVFKTYERYLDVDSFVDYFLINEYFGNYDSGQHSTYMWKTSGDRLHIGPVWDFDQAMNNAYNAEQDPASLAMQERPFFDRLTKDRSFLDKLMARWAEIRESTFSEAHVFAVIQETAAYLEAAQQREWYRWAADYYDNSAANIHNYYLRPYTREGVDIERFNDEYRQELYNLRVYLSRHGNAIPIEVKKLYDSATITTGLRSENALFLAVVLLLLVTPSFLINKRG